MKTSLIFVPEGRPIVAQGFSPGKALLQARIILQTLGLAAAEIAVGGGRFLVLGALVAPP